MKHKPIEWAAQALLKIWWAFALFTVGPALLAIWLKIPGDIAAWFIAIGLGTWILWFLKLTFGFEVRKKGKGIRKVKITRNKGTIIINALLSDGVWRQRVLEKPITCRKFLVTILPTTAGALDLGFYEQPDPYTQQNWREIRN